VTFRGQPGQTPLPESSGLKIKIQTMGEVHQAEEENVHKATVKYFGKRLTKRSAPFDLSWVKKLHREMLGEVWKWAGEFRRADIDPKYEKCHQIEPRTQCLLDDLKSWEVHGDDLVEQATMLHYRAVQIHPFAGGNGRWSRMLANIWLRLHKHPITRWPNELHGGASIIRKQYIAAIQLADSGDLDSLIELHRRYTSPS
jgi:fido (protein-threonine AMPylation protein)